jgi:hypothetical protein
VRVVAAPWVSSLGGEGGDFGEVVGQDAVAVPDPGAGESVEAGAVELVAVFEVADAAFAAGSLFDEAAEAGLSFLGLAGGCGSAFAGDGDGFHAGVVQVGFDVGFAVAAVGGHGRGRLTGAVVDAFDRGCQLRGAGWVALLVWSRTMPSALSMIWAL